MMHMLGLRKTLASRPRRAAPSAAGGKGRSQVADVRHIGSMHYSSYNPHYNNGRP